MTNIVDPNETVSSGSTFFAQVSVLVCKAERVEEKHLPVLMIIDLIVRSGSKLLMLNVAAMEN